MTREVTPNTTVVPDGGNGGSDADWERWINEAYTGNDHPIATAAMMRRELGGACFRLPFSFFPSAYLRTFVNSP